MATTVLSNQKRTKLERHTNASAANTALTLTTPTGAVRRFLYTTVKYSAAPTHSGITANLDSGAGAAYDTELSKSAANLQNWDYQATGDVSLLDDDAIAVTAPAGGAGITSQITIVTEAA